MSIYDKVSCKFTDCPNRVVGSSITGTGHVCVGHNLEEWGRSLRRYDPKLAAGLEWDASHDLEAAHARLKRDGDQLALRVEERTDG